MSELLVSVRALDVTYGRRLALSDINLDLREEHGIVGLFGPNGAGKTTLIRVLTDQIRRYRGRIRVEGQPSYLPDEPFIYSFLTVSQMLRYSRRLFSDFRSDVAEEIISQLGLSPNLRVREASKGMSEQLHIAMALARSGPVFAFDEPLAAVDPVTRAKLVDLITQHKPRGSVVILSTHILEGLADLFDSYIVISEGTLRAQGLVDDGVRQEGLESIFRAAIKAD